MIPPSWTLGGMAELPPSIRQWTTVFGTKPRISYNGFMSSAMWNGSETSCLPEPLPAVPTMDIYL